MYSPPKESTLEGVIGILVPSARIFLLAFRSRSPFGRRTVSIGLRVLPLHHIAQQERSRDIVRSAAPQLDDRVRVARQPARDLQLLSLPSHSAACGKLCSRSCNFASRSSSAS